MGCAEISLGHQPIPVDDNTGSPSLEGAAQETIQDRPVLPVRCFGDFVVTSGGRTISP